MYYIGIKIRERANSQPKESSMAKKQPSFSDLDYDNKKKTTRKDLFLQKMNEVYLGKYY